MVFEHILTIVFAGTVVPALICEIFQFSGHFIPQLAQVVYRNNAPFINFQGLLVWIGSDRYAAHACIITGLFFFKTHYRRKHGL
jgi:hypothetical protein